MIFNSVSFLLFLALVIGLYWALPKTPRLWLVFSVSLIFYGFWRIEFIPLMLFSALIDYSAALAIFKSQSSRNKKIFLTCSLCVNLGLLFYFKYSLFVLENAITALSIFGFHVQQPTMEIILPLGISFYTFQTISYTVDVYRGFIKPERNFIVYGCYVTFFPQLIAGPILRAKEILHQLNSIRHHNWVDFGHGVRWILYGLFLKVVLADNLAPLVDNGFSQPLTTLSALDVWTLAFLFGFQIYFDFSAYSHIAIGSARLMGLHFPDNFYYPYLSNSPREFWRRWHISLSSWIRDYLYLPLIGTNVQDRSTGGLAVVTDKNKQHSKKHLILALFLTWSIMGLWHGANWTFLLWGVYHATLIAFYRFLSPLIVQWNRRLVHFLGLFITLPLIMLGWIPFRSQSVSDALTMLGKLIYPHNYLWLGMRENVYLIAMLTLTAVFSTFYTRKVYNILIKKGCYIGIQLAIETAVFTVIMALIFIFLRPIQQFIYFQF